MSSICEIKNSTIGAIEGNMGPLFIVFPQVMQILNTKAWPHLTKSYVTDAKVCDVEWYKGDNHE